MRFCYRCPEHRNCHGIISAEAGFLSFKPAIFGVTIKEKLGMRMTEWKEC